MRGVIKKGDIIIIAALLVLAAALLILSLLPKNGGSTAVISVDGKVVAELPLEVDTTYSVTNGGGTNIIEIKDGRVRMTVASCPDGYCVRQGGISETGESIVCLPNRVTVTVSGESGVDAVVS